MQHDQQPQPVLKDDMPMVYRPDGSRTPTFGVNRISVTLGGDSHGLPVFGGYEILEDYTWGAVANTATYPRWSLRFAAESDASPQAIRCRRGGTFFSFCFKMCDLFAFD